MLPVRTLFRFYLYRSVSFQPFYINDCFMLVLDNYYLIITEVINRFLPNTLFFKNKI